MENKTVVQQLLDIVKIEHQKNAEIPPKAFYEILRNFLEAEKQQIVDAYVKGCDDTYGCDESDKVTEYDKEVGEEYYYQKFK